jgi:hypothetical protein
MMETQIVGGLGHLRIEHRIAAEAENISLAATLRPFHRFHATIMTVAAPQDAGVRPMPPQTLGHVLDDGPHLRALRSARRAKDGGNRGAARHVMCIDAKPRSS